MRIVFENRKLEMLSQYCQVGELNRNTPLCLLIKLSEPSSIMSMLLDVCLIYKDIYRVWSVPIIDTQTPYPILKTYNMPQAVAFLTINQNRERSGSVVECLTRD